MRLSLLCILVFICTTSMAKNKIYLANNQATVSIAKDSESNFKLTINLKLQDNFQSWDLGFFMLHVFVGADRSSYNANICKDSRCMPLMVDDTQLAKSLSDYIKPELSSGHVTLFKPIKPFILMDGESYVITISGLKNMPKNITAMPQSIFLRSGNHAEIIPIKVTSYGNNLYDEKSIKSQIESRNLSNWYATPNPKIIDSIVVPYPQKTEFGVGVNNRQENILVTYCKVNDTNSLCLGIQNKAEGYVLKITTDSINIFANTQAGVFYAKQTYAQLNDYYNGAIPVQIITDYPRFQYRGLMLDTVRHFFSVSDIKHLLDLMSVHKLNVLHLHLADDEGWRIQLPSYPQLTKIGSTRKFGYRIGPSNLVDSKYDITNRSKKEYANADTLYQGYYSVADIKDLISYANNKQITIIPEVELPGHAKALKKAFPEIFYDSNDQSKYFSVQGYNDSVLPICKYSNDSNFTNTLNGIIKETASLFANQTTINYIKNEVSLSGDEVPNGAYTNYPLCNNGIYKNLTGDDITHMFFKQLSNNLPGYKLSGWQELVQSSDGLISQNSMSSDKAGHIWEWQPTTHTPVSGLDMAASLSSAKYPTVINFADYTYFDIRYNQKWDEPGLYWSNDQTDTFSALNSSLAINNISDTNNILGIEGAIWSELIPSSDHLFYMLVPKMAGLSDAAWSNQNAISWRSLVVRLGCGKSGFLYYLNKNYNIYYHGYPNGIKEEVPNSKFCN